MILIIIVNVIPCLDAYSVNSREFMENIIKKLKYIRIESKQRRIQNIDHRRNFIFIHIPKNAGTAIYEALGMSRSHHYSSRSYKKILGNAKYDQMIKIAFHRNPWDRFLSLYNYARMDVSYYHNNINPKDSLYGAHEDYELLKRATLEDCADLLVEGRLKHSKICNHWYPQAEWLKDTNGVYIEPDFLGCFEDINSDFEKLKKLLGITTNLARRNISKKSYYRDLMTDKVRKIVAKYYEEDVEIFKYQY